MERKMRGDLMFEVKAAGRREPMVDSLNIPGDHYCLFVRGLPRQLKLEVVLVEVCPE